MAVNDFWRRLAGQTDPGETNINPQLLSTALIDLASGDGLTLVQIRGAFGLAVGTDGGTEFTDLITSFQSLPGTAGPTGTRLPLQERLLGYMVGSAQIAGRGTVKFPGNPYPNANALRQRVRALVTRFGGTPAGTLAPA